MPRVVCWWIRHCNPVGRATWELVSPVSCKRNWQRQTVQQRKELVKNIDEVYPNWLAVVHHGQTARHAKTVDRFLVDAWATMSRLLDLVPEYRTKAALIGALEDLKMS